MTLYRLGLVFAAAFAVFLVMNAPLSVAAHIAGLRAAGLQYDRAEGPVWGGVLTGASVNGHRLGDMDVAVGPLSLLRGRLRVDVAFSGDGVAGEGVLERGLNRHIAVYDAKLSGDLRRLAAVDPNIPRNAGVVTADIEKIAFSAQGCRAAEGLLWTDALVQADPRWNWTGPDLTGAVACAEDGALLLPLSGASDGEMITLQTKVAKDLTYAFTASITTKDQRVAQILALLGFEGAAPGPFEYSFQGPVPGLT